ncbi:hypothetical protein [Agrococcus sp. SCSIO52902]|uniref:hypothetical protein n=1 Tax=Agrococcus sp. SCSIO52902 TaxID=2933290 RepID=UPI001FF492AF|nr:hypothetical protein [Agrococcus sp. SCSIO52902]UOW01262.1 hypothetical protein MU522_02205 [Agrococcus sp. SCSIO52902]
MPTASPIGELERVERWVHRLAAFVRHVFDEWTRAFPEVPHPRIWAYIAHLIDPKDTPQGGTT